MDSGADERAGASALRLVELTAVGDLPPAARAPLLLLGLVALLSGVLGGLARLGVGVPAPASGVGWHGALMASAFFGTLISLERAVAIGRLWAYAAPAAGGAGGIALLLGYATAGFALFLLGALVFVVASLAIWQRQRALHTGVLALGAIALLAANMFLAGGAPPEAMVTGWLAFFTLTIGGERLELSRLAPVPAAARFAFGAISIATLGVSMAAPLDTSMALRLTGLLLVGIAIWLARYDIATRTVRATGLTRYIALCLLAGYIWLAIGAAVLVFGAGPAEQRESWDAALHAILIGFVFSMVFGHAPVILPAVLRVALPYRPLLYAPLVLLHLALIVRVTGDLFQSAALRSAGGAGNAIAIALFILSALGLVISGRGKSRGP